MMLYAAVHTVEAVTAKVPLSMIVLSNHLKQRSIPAEFKLRLMFPTSGLQSISIWEALDSTELHAWLTENLGADCTTEVSEVQEDFMYGYGLELTRLRTSDKVAQNSQKTLEVVGGKTAQAAEYVGEATLKAVSAARQQLEDLDSRTGVLTAAKTTTSAAITRVKTASTKALENETVSAAVQNVGAAAAASWKRVGASLSWVGDKLKSQEMMGRSESTTSQHLSDPARCGWTLNPLYGNVLQMDAEKANASGIHHKDADVVTGSQQQMSIDVLLNKDQWVIEESPDTPDKTSERAIVV